MRIPLALGGANRMTFVRHKSAESALARRSARTVRKGSWSIHARTCGPAESADRDCLQAFQVSSEIREDPNFDDPETQLLSAHYSNSSPFRARWRSKCAGLRFEAGSAGDRREPVQTVGPPVESGCQPLVRRRMLPRKHALARLPRMKGLPRRSRMTKKWDASALRAEVDDAGRGDLHVRKRVIGISHAMIEKLPRKAKQGFRMRRIVGDIPLLAFAGFHVE